MRPTTCWSATSNCSSRARPVGSASRSSARGPQVSPARATSGARAMRSRSTNRSRSRAASTRTASRNTRSRPTSRRPSWGPAGLACARDLRRKGHAVTVYESKPQPGGLNTYGIAEYKLKADVALAEVEDILELGIELKTGTRVDAIEPLLADYDAVFVAIGLGNTK